MFVLGFMNNSSADEVKEGNDPMLSSFVLKRNLLRGRNWPRVMSEWVSNMSCSYCCAHKPCLYFHRLDFFALLPDELICNSDAKKHHPDETFDWLFIVLSVRVPPWNRRQAMTQQQASAKNVPKSEWPSEEAPKCKKRDKWANECLFLLLFTWASLNKRLKRFQNGSDRETGDCKRSIIPRTWLNQRFLPPSFKRFSFCPSKLLLERGLKWRGRVIKPWR